MAARAMSPSGQIYRDRRAAGLCGACGKVKSTSARCHRCAAALSRARYDVEGCALGGRGTWGQPPATLLQIAEALGTTREYARQIQEQAIAKVAERLQVDRETALLGLAALGCRSGEQALPTESRINVGAPPEQGRFAW